MGPQVPVRLSDFKTIAVNLFGKAVVCAAKWVVASRRRGLRVVAAKPDGDKDKGILLLRDRVAQLQSQNAILRLLRKPDITTRCACAAVSLVSSRPFGSAWGGRGSSECGYSSSHPATACTANLRSGRSGSSGRGSTARP